MGRVLQALQRVGTTYEADRAMRPLTREELEAFGLHWPAGLSGSEETVPGESPVGPTGDTADETLPEVRGDRSAATVERDRGQADSERGVEPSPSEPEGSRQHLGSAHDRGTEAASTHGDTSQAVNPVLPQWQQEYRKLAQRILAQTPSRHGATLLFSGVNEDSPTSAVLGDLAAHFTELVCGQVLVVDADFCGSGLSRRYEVEAEQTITEVLAGVADWQQVEPIPKGPKGVRTPQFTSQVLTPQRARKGPDPFWDRLVIQQTDTPRLSILPGSRLSPDRQAAIFSRLGRLLGPLRQHFQLVLIGAAPATRPEMQSLARYTDGVYLVIERHCTLRRTARRLVRRLERRGIPVQGCVLTETAG